MDITQRKIYLSKIGRARIKDYFEIINCKLQARPDKEIPDGIFQVTTRTKYDKSGNVTYTKTSVKMADPIRAIHELNKMDGGYPIRQETFDSVAHQKSLEVVEKLKKYLENHRRRMKYQMEKNKQNE